jgi:hypothetical protein
VHTPSDRYAIKKRRLFGAAIKPGVAPDFFLHHIFKQL